MLVSGQLSRWIYWANFGKLPKGASSLFEGTGKEMATSKCVPVFDLFAVFDNSSQAFYYQTDFINRVVDLHTDNPEGAIARGVQFHRDAGFRNVTVQLYDRNHIDNENMCAISDINAQAAANRLHTRKDIDQWWSRLPSKAENFAFKFPITSRMYWLRHTAFQLALQSGAGHRWFLYCREDNIFFHPVVGLRGWAAKVCHLSGPLVAVDNTCGYGGSWTDKVFFANREGAEILWAASEQNYSSRLLSWLTQNITTPPGVRPSPGMRSAKKHDQLQSEWFFTELLKGHGAQVTRMSFRRMDVRVVPRSVFHGEHEAPLLPHQPPDSSLCIAHLYFKDCKPDRSVGITKTTIGGVRNCGEDPVPANRSDSRASAQNLPKVSVLTCSRPSRWPGAAMPWAIGIGGLAAVGAIAVALRRRE